MYRWAPSLTPMQQSRAHTGVEHSAPCHQGQVLVCEDREKISWTDVVRVSIHAMFINFLGSPFFNPSMYKILSLFYIGEPILTVTPVNADEILKL